MFSSKNTIKEVAKRAGVSIATVSRFLTNSSSIKKENQKRVEKAIQELNYRPSLYARRLAGGKLDTFGLIIPGYEGVFYSFYALEIVKEVASALDQRSIDLHLNIFHEKDSFKTSLIDGVIMADIIGNEKQLKRLVEEEVPLVVINRKVEDFNVSFVAIDNFKGAYEATEFLIHHGHKKIVHLAGDLRVQCAKERLQGYNKALEKNGITAKEDYIKITNFSRKDARAKLEELFFPKKNALAKKDIPTAIFCCSDEVASEVLNFAEEKKIQIPKDLSVIGFDDNPHCLYGNLMLTTVRQPLKSMVHQAVKILKGLTTGSKGCEKRVLDTELIVRDTVDFL